MYDISYREIWASDMGALIESRPDIPVPVQRAEKIAIPGRDGDYFIKDKTWEDIQITIQMSFNAVQANTWNEYWRRIKNWLQGEGKLIFSEDPLYFYQVKMVEPDTAERELRKYGRFQVVFTCEPYQYSMEGAAWKETSANGLLINPSELPSHPVYKITGEGVCTLTVNGYEMIANVGQNLVVDTERQMSYRMDKTPQNTSVTGDYTKLYLKPEDNIISVTEGFSLRVQPNWRYL